MTATDTTPIEINIALKERKKKKNIREVEIRAATIKSPISSIIFWALRVRIYGIPEVCTFSPVRCSNFSTIGIKSLRMKSLRALVFTIFLFIYTAVCSVLLLAL